MLLVGILFGMFNLSVNWLLIVYDVSMGLSVNWELGVNRVSGCQATDSQQMADSGNLSKLLCRFFLYLYL